MIKSIENKFNIFENIVNSPIIDDISQNNIYYNEEYSFRLPHENDLVQSIIKYNIRFERFINYKNDISNNYLFIRIINHGIFNISKENLEENYNEENYYKLISYLPINSKILLITHKKILENEKNKIFKKFYVMDNIIIPNHIAYGEYLEKKEYIIGCYQKCFDYICNNFENFDENILYNFIKNDNIGINFISKF
jgi:hypothetical protein